MRYIETNTILATKDGRKIGNAIVITCNGVHCEIKTDYGNQMLLTIEEMEEYFHISDNEADEPWAGRSATHKYRIDR